MSWQRSRWPALFIAIVAALTNGCSNPAPPISVTVSAHAPAIDQGQTDAITATVANDRSSDGVSWSLTGPGTIDNTGMFVTYTSPSTALTSAQTVTVTATSVADRTKTSSIQITVNPYPQIPFQTIANGTMGAAYTQTIMLTGGTPPFQWSVYNGPIPTGNYVGGAVPDGLALNAGTGVISGTPTGGGTWYFQAIVTDAAGVTVDNPFLSIEISSNAPAGNPIPFLNQPLVPTTIAPAGGDSTLKVSGSGFVSGATVDFNGTPLTTLFVDGGHLTAENPAVNTATAGTAAISVMNPAPGGGRSNVVYFPVGAPSSAVHFANAANSPLQAYEPFAIVEADFNEDGKPDIAIASGIRVYVLLGNGDGTFTASAGSPIPMPSPPYDDLASPYAGLGMAAGDFNNSGHVGLAVGLFNNLAAATFFGNGNGTFTASPTLANTAVGSLTALTAADFNRDGYLDVVAVGAGGGVSPTPLLGYGHGAFNGVVENLEMQANSSAAGDFNGDGNLDLLVSGTVAFGNGDGTFTQGPVLTGDFSAVGDFNGDGKLDLAVCSSFDNRVTIFLGDGAGNFAPASNSPISVGLQPEAILTGDFNNDGKLDLAIANAGDNTVTLLLGNGDGTFTQASGSPYPVGTFPFSIAAADFNGDGKLDLAVANLSDGTVSILMQQ